MLLNSLSISISCYNNICHFMCSLEIVITVKLVFCYCFGKENILLLLLLQRTLRFDYKKWFPINNIHIREVRESIG